MSDGSNADLQDGQYTPLPQNTPLVVPVVRALVGGLDSTPDRRDRLAGPAGGSARQILDMRYAEGELSTEDYQHRLLVLNGGKS